MPPTRLEATPCLVCGGAQHSEVIRTPAQMHPQGEDAMFTPETLRELLQRAGWEVVTAHAYGTFDPYVLWWMSRLEARGVDWSGSMEAHLPRFVLGSLLTLPLFALQRWINLGIQTAIARPA